MKNTIPAATLALGLGLLAASAPAQTPPKFKVIGFYTGQNDLAHISFMHEANQWFPKMAREHGFTYDSTNNWNNLNAAYLSQYQVVVFLDTRPPQAAQRAAFKTWMEGGGAWMGFHFAAFSLAGSAYTNDWPWYHDQFLGAGQYKSNTWRPTSATLKVEDRSHPATARLGDTFKAAPNEWYAWQNDLRTKPDIKILLSVDPVSFPLGTGPKQHEIWRSGYYPVAWTNRNYRMLYVNMGHNDMDYDGGTNRTLSYTFANETQNRLILDALLWMGGRDPVGVPTLAAPARRTDLRAVLAGTTGGRLAVGDAGGAGGAGPTVTVYDLLGGRVAAGRPAGGVLPAETPLGAGRYVLRSGPDAGAPREGRGAP